MPKFATLNSKFSYISIVKSKVPWVDKLSPDIKSKLKKRGFWNSFILLCHLCSKLRKFQVFTKCMGRRRGRVTTYVSCSPPYILKNWEEQRCWNLFGHASYLDWFENHLSPNNKIYTRNINFLSVRMKFCQTNHGG